MAKTSISELAQMNLEDIQNGELFIVSHPISAGDLYETKSLNLGILKSNISTEMTAYVDNTVQNAISSALSGLEDILHEINTGSQS